MTVQKFTTKYGTHTVSLVLRRLADKANLDEDAHDEAYKIADDLQNMLEGVKHP